MTKHTAVALIALIGLGAPALAAAQDQSSPPPQLNSRDYEACQNQKTGHTVVGAVAGGVLGAVLGSQVAGHGARTEGSVLVGGLGALAGAAVGNDTVRCGPSPALQARRAEADPGYYSGPAPVDHSYDNTGAPSANDEDQDRYQRDYREPRGGDAYRPPAYQDNGGQDQDDQDQHSYRDQRSYQDERSYQGQQGYQDERSYQDQRSYQDERTYQGDEDAQGQADQDSRYGDDRQGRDDDRRVYRDDQGQDQMDDNDDQSDQDDHAYQNERGYPDNGYRRPSERY